jgi:histidinol dehydrogenase
MVIPVRRWRDLDPAERSRILARSEQNIDDLLPVAREIVDAVARRGDAAVREYTHTLDRAPLDSAIVVRESDFVEAERSLSPEVRAALDYAITNVRAVHEHQRGPALELLEVRPGVLAGERTVPIDSVGLYVPRGRGSFPSMLYMLAVPATLAGVPRVAIATPPDEHGSVDAACLYAARQCGVSRVYAIGGVQAIAALAIGTESVERVVKIVGPGSAYVAAAKRVLRDRIDVGIPAGPSESIILADGSADAERVATDLLIEAEHGSDSQALLITTSEELAHAVSDLVAALIDQTPDTPEPRRQFLGDVFADYGGIILAGSDAEASAIVNEFAPEHLQIRTRDPWSTMNEIRNAGEILLGEHSAFSLANYAAGANAVLPTGGLARTWSGVSVHDFVKRTSVVRVSRSGYPEIARHARVLAEYERFHWHARALSDRPGIDLDGET